MITILFFLLYLLQPAIAQCKTGSVCVFRISGQYGFMQRLLFYLLLLFAVVAHRAEWLIHGALAAAMTYSASAAIHALILVGVHKKGILDLDIFGVYCILSSSIIILGPMLDWCKALRDSAAWLIFKIWGVVVSIGLVCVVVLIRKTYDGSDKCKISTPIRSENEAEPKACERVFGPSFQILREATLASLILMVLSLLSILARRSGDPVVLWERNEWHFTLRHGVQHERLRFRFNTVKPILIKILYGIIAPLAFVTNIILAERYIWQKQPEELPFIEEPLNVGQWSPWVSTGFVLLAAAITQANVWRKNRESLPFWRNARERKS